MVGNPAGRLRKFHTLFCHCWIGSFNDTASSSDVVIELLSAKVFSRNKITCIYNPSMHGPE